MLKLDTHHPPEVDRPIEWVARHDRLVVAASLAAVIAVAWALLIADADMDMRMDMSESHSGHPLRHADLGRFLALLVMWVVMMVAMMLPSAAPTILLFAALTRARASASALPRTAGFAAGYLFLWGIFSFAATVAHVALEHAALVSSAMRTTTSVLTALLLVAAGIYQWTPMKHACLKNCRSPVHFMTRHWRPGWGGAFQLGLFHGVYCAGCCWALMALLFVGGVMNLVWVAALATFVLLEKTTFLGSRLGRAVSGVALLAAGAVALVLR